MAQVFIYILIRSRDSFINFDKCVDSVYNQTYRKYKIIYIDDATPLKKTQKAYIKEKLVGHIVILNKKRQYSLKNAYLAIHKYAKDERAVIFNLDGDDWLPNDNCLRIVADTYRQNPECLFTYGECSIWNGSKLIMSSKQIRSNTNIKYPKYVVTRNQFRRYPFIPLHPRTWKVWVFKKIKKSDFLRSDGSWIKFAEDQAIFFPLLEMSGGRYRVISRPIYVYNIASKKSDLRMNLLNLYKDEIVIRRKNPYEPFI